MDDAVQCLDRHDVEKVKQAAADNRRATCSSRTFRKDFAEKAAQLRERAPVEVEKAPLPAEISQAEVRRFMPEGSSTKAHSIWLSGSGSWNGHVPPNPRVGASFSRWGTSQAALRAVLALVWAQWLELKGLPKTACPWENLLD